MRISLVFLSLILLYSCASDQRVFDSYEAYPTPLNDNLWLDYSEERTIFRIWSPTAEEARVNLYANGSDGAPVEQYIMSRMNNGVWLRKVEGDLQSTYYTYNVKAEGQWLDETPGIYAQAVGANGQRAMVIDLDRTDPEGWRFDKGPEVNYPNEAIIYELHIRDMTIYPQSGSSYPGTYEGLVEAETKGPSGVATAIDHLEELGITHVHLLPTYDHYSIDESKLDSARFNWGYDPQNYNVPEGSFSSDPYNGATRIAEFKKMVKAFHDRGIGLILDVVYNHTGIHEGSNFNLENPGYYYRHWEDGKVADASACGNETASDREMMRRFIKESVLYWAKEYHLDGFRFDLMGIHDMETMKEITEALKSYNSNIIIYGEGWTAGDSPLPEKRRALKKHTLQMPQVSAFSDDLRDGLKGSVFSDEEGGFVSGTKGRAESIKFGVVGSIEHPQIDYKAVNYSDEPWANEPWQAISYVSCHDNHTIYDKLKVSRPDASESDIIAMDKLANAIVMTSQGVAFMHAGAEMLRTKNGEHNSYNLPDAINQIDWSRKTKYKSVFEYYKNLISFRKSHPAFYMSSQEEVVGHLEFKTVEEDLLSYTINDHANGDTWDNILVIYNAKADAVPYSLDGSWKVAVEGDSFYDENGTSVLGTIEVPAISMMVLYQD